MSTAAHRPLIVLIHGWPVTEAHWRQLTPLLDEGGFEVLPITLPGLGGALDQVTSVRKTDLARWVSGRLTHLGMTPCAVIGHDWGGTVATFLAAEVGSAMSALVVEEEILPGVTVDIPTPGSDHYPSWHGRFNRAPGLAEQLVPGRESDYYGTFLRQSAGPAALDPDTVRSYVDAYSGPGFLEAGLGYYRSRDDDIRDVRDLVASPVTVPTLAVGGRFAMGSAVADGMRRVASDVTGYVAANSGHYPLEQEPASVGPAVIRFLLQHCSTP